MSAYRAPHSVDGLVDPYIVSGSLDHNGLKNGHIAYLYKANDYERNDIKISKEILEHTNIDATNDQIAKLATEVRRVLDVFYVRKKHPKKEWDFLKKFLKNEFPMPFKVSHTPKESEKKSSQKKSNSGASDTRLLTDVKLQEGQKYRLGDMFWAKVGNHPFWPCMVYYGPGLDIYFKKKGKLATYHVQFFGPLVERAWVTDCSLIPFEGKTAFDMYVEDQLAKDKKLSKSRFEVKPNRKAVWDASWKEAELAYPLSKDERVFRFGRIYVMKTKSSTSGTETPKVKTEPQQPAAKKAKHTPPRVTIKHPYKNESDEKGFRKYFEEEVANIQAENGNFSDDDVENYAWALWNEMSEVEKTKYIESVESRSGRRIKLSLKNLHLKAQKIISKSSSSESRKRPIPSDSPQSSKSTLNSPVPKKRHKEVMQPINSNFAIYPPSPSNSDRASISVVDDNVDLGEDDNDHAVYEFQRLHRSTPSGRSIEHVCCTCEDSGSEELHRCQSCGNYFHLACVGESLSANPFKCKVCRKGHLKCFQCGKDICNDCIRCSNKSCEKAYHKKCVDNLTFTKGLKDDFLCPSHLCHACAIDDPFSTKSRQGRLVRCLRCPKAYHAGELCLPAGSSELSATYIICPQHFDFDTKTNKRVNVAWCFTCAQTGDLLNCQTCPAAYHRECLPTPINLKDVLDFTCHHCVVGKQPRYGEIVWAKVGFFRWWPCEVLHPRDTPANIQKLQHQKGMFPVHFFGSDEYAWLTKSRVFPYEYTVGSDRQKLSIKVDSGSNKKLKIWFKNGKTSAVEAFQAWKEFLNDHLTSARGERKRESSESDSSIKIIESTQTQRPAPYKFTKENVPIAPLKHFTVETSELPRCECYPTQPSPCGADCLNRMLMYECHQSVCPAGKLCENQRFAKKQYPQQAVIRTSDRGWGLKSVVDISKGDFVNEYVGDLIDEEEARRRLDDAHVRSVHNFYMLTLDKGRIIDAGPRGNFSRFMNHSCNPNLETQKWMVNGDLRIGLFAIRDIAAGEELTFNYNFQSLTGAGEDTPCLCHSTNCSGFLGIRPRSQAMTPNSTASGEAPRTVVPKPNLGFVECYRCGDGGELISCEEESCKKSYHLFCLGLTKPPWGKWHCPWHHCDVCGGKSKSLCTKCPNSFCEEHHEGQIEEINGNGLICRDHAGS